jgi:hypothetical protein
MSLAATAAGVPKAFASGVEQSRRNSSATDHSEAKNETAGEEPLAGASRKVTSKLSAV